MIYKFLSLLFFCGACVSAFGQELQSPQINQNAIFANPGLAGSKGQTRVCLSTGILHNYNYENYSTMWKPQTKNYFTNTASIDGLLFKKSIGFGTYIQNTNLSDENVYTYSSSLQGPSDTISKSISHSKYSQIGIGIMIAPKFYFKNSDNKKSGRSISPSFAIGIRNNNAMVDYTFTRNTNLSDSTYSSTTKDSYFSISNVSLGFLYNTAKGYSGIKFGLNNIQEGRFEYITSFVFAHSFSNKNNFHANFSFNPHGYIALHWTQVYNAYYLNWGTNIAINLDFRYKKMIFGAYLYNNYGNYLMPGVMAGIQLKSLRIAANISPNLTQSEETYSGHFSVNFSIPTKSN